MFCIKKKCVFCSLQKIPEKDYLVHLVFAIIRVSAVSLNNQEALRISSELYRDCYEYAQKTNQVNDIQFKNI